MVVGVMPLLVLVAFAPMEMQGLGAGPFDPLLTTADVPRLFSGAGTVSQHIDSDSNSSPLNMSCWLGLVHSRASSMRLL